MVEINFLDKNGNIRKIEANNGASLLEVSKKNNINLEGSCGGEMLCSTCHVHIISNHLITKKKKRRKRDLVFIT